MTLMNNFTGEHQTLSGKRCVCLFKNRLRVVPRATRKKTARKTEMAARNPGGEVRSIAGLSGFTETKERVNVISTQAEEFLNIVLF